MTNYKYPILTILFDLIFLGIFTDLTDGGLISILFLLSLIIATIFSFLAYKYSGFILFSGLLITLNVLAMAVLLWMAFVFNLIAGKGGLL